MATFEQPSLDQRIYKHVTIGPSKEDGQQQQQSSSLDILLISDPDTDKASAAMDIHVGQLCDLPQYPGIAHFCEHMLFIGTTKYPIENDYDSFLTNHGGSSNAFTDLEHTCYFFDIQASELEGALDRFAQCFISPLFTQSAIEREVQAVDSEHHKNLQLDYWRQYQLSKSTLVIPPPTKNKTKELEPTTTTTTAKNPQYPHAYGRFGNGNQETLPVSTVRDALLKYYNENYCKSLSLYKLVVLGKESVEELESMVKKYFHELPHAMKKTQTPQANEEEKEIEDTKEEKGVEDSSLPSSGGGMLQRKEMLQSMFPPVPEWQVPQRLHVVPVNQIHSLELQFPMSSQLSYWESKPSRYLSHLIGHEGKGSLLSLLKQKDYALELYADDSSKSCISWNIFTIKIELTELGLTNVNEVVQIVFSYIELMKTNGPQEWIQQELQTVQELQFRFMSQRNPMEYTSSLAGWMQLYPPNSYLSGPYTISKWDPHAIDECLQFLNPDNVLWIVSSPTFGQPVDHQLLIEPWYGTQYECIELDEPFQNQLRTALANDFPELTFPQKNDMIATNFDLLSEEFRNHVPKDQPQCISLITSHTKDESSTRVIPDMQLWYKPDNVFDMPKVNLLFHFSSSIANSTPQAIIATKMFVEWIQEQVNEYTYLASMAGLHCHVGVSSNTGGMDIQVSGYHHKAHVLLEHLFSVILTSLVSTSSTSTQGDNDVDEDDSELFARLKYKLEQQWQSFFVAQPYQHAMYVSDLVLEEGKITIEQKLSALQLVNKAMVVEHAKHFWKDCRMIGLCHGNISPQHAKEMTHNIWSQLCTLRGPEQKEIFSMPSENRVVQLSPGTSYLVQFQEYNEANTNSCMQMILQFGPMSLKDNATLAVLHHLIQEPAFNQLRTEEQLGYLVHTSIKTSGLNVKGMIFLIQSESFDPSHVERRVEEFLERFRPKIVDMTPQDFTSNINAVVTSLLEKNKNLGEESTRYWHVMMNQSYHFSRLQEIADHVKDLDKDTVLSFFDSFIAPSAPHRRKLCIQVFATQHVEKMIEQDPSDSNKDNVVRIKDPLEFRRCMPLYPLPKRSKIDLVSDLDCTNISSTNTEGHGFDTPIEVKVVQD